MDRIRLRSQRREEMLDVTDRVRGFATNEGFLCEFDGPREREVWVTVR